MVVAQQSSKLTGLAKQLVVQSLLSEEDTIAAIDTAKKNKTPFIHHIVKNKLVNSLDIATLASTEFGAPLLDINAIEIESSAVNIIKEDLITIS